MQTFETRRKPSKKEIFTYIVKKNHILFYSIINICFLIVAVLKGHISFIDILSCFAVAFTSVYLFSFIRTRYRSRIVYKVDIDETSQEIAFHYFFMIPRVEKIPFSEFHYDCALHENPLLGGEIIISRQPKNHRKSAYRFSLYEHDTMYVNIWDIQTLIQMSESFDRVRHEYLIWDIDSIKNPKGTEFVEKVHWSTCWTIDDAKQIQMFEKYEL